MSQANASLLDEVVQWSQETCRQELKAVLPKLTSLHYESESWNEHNRILKIITEMFLPHVGSSKLEDEVFSKILPKVELMFSSMIKELMGQVGGFSSQNTELCAFLRSILQGMMQVIDALSACVRHVGSFDKVPDFVAIRSLPSCVLNILRETFQHCKDSETVYCGRLSTVADLLQGLFKEAYCLQRGLQELLEKMSMDSGASEKEVSDIVAVIHSLLGICSIISNLDIALHANTWKFLIKQSLKYQSLVEEHLHHRDIISGLSDNVLASLTSCMDLAEQITLAGLQESTQSPDYKLFQKTAKMSRFFANTLIHYIKEFKCFLSKFCSIFHQLYLEISSKFPPSLSAPVLAAALAGELSAAALVPMDAFLLQLMPLRPFAELVLQQDLHLSPEHELPHCLLLVNIMGHLASQPEEVMRLWFTGSQFSEDTPRLPLYQAVLMSFRRCYVERMVPVLVPGVMLKGQAQTQVTLHHHVCVHICASVAVLPPAYFPALERSLLNAALQADAQTAVLAADVWCFTARYGTAELCLHHVLLIAQMVKACAAESYQLPHLGMLLKRMVFLMTPGHQMELLEKFPPSKAENLSVWQHVLVRALSQDARLRLETEIIGLTQRVLTEWQDDGYKLGQVDKVNAALSSLLSVLRGPAAPDERRMSSAVSVIAQLWSRMSPDQVRAHPVLQQTLQVLLSATATLVKHVGPRDICQALLCLEAAVTPKCAASLLLAALDFLSALGKIFVPPDCQNQILPKLSGLFGVLLSSDSWLLQQHALEAFSSFAEDTNHEEVISQSLSDDETKSKVLSYLSKTLSSEGDEASRLQRLKQEATVTEEHRQKLERREVDCVQSAAGGGAEPCAKRSRQETSAEAEFSRHLEAAQSALRALQGLLTGGHGGPPPPAWLEGRVQELLALVNGISGLCTRTL